ncbi:MAG TPA: cupin domain-containing protein [Caulobacteraceae bacterium]|jgi:uncharacterized cupin superfamily protein|nr:cupin domain-containing protein [Caulobacteraceae bacterium]
MPKIDPAKAEVSQGSRYPSPHDAPCAERLRRRLGDAGGLGQFGVNQLTLAPGVWSSQRHWHSHEDEFVYVLSGEVVLVTDADEETLRAGDSAAFPAGEPNGHHLVNRSAAPATLLEVGTRSPDDVTTYSAIDMMAGPDGLYRTKAGVPL